MLQAPKSADEISDELRLFSIRRVSVLVDDTTDEAMIEAIPATGVEGFHTFTAAVAGRRIGAHVVDLLPGLATAPDGDGWLVATRSKAGYALNDYLRRHHLEEKVVLTLARDHVSPMYSYVDLFHGETRTVAYISNNFERGYKIHFPIAVRFLLRADDGTVLKAWQRILAPNQTVAVDSRELALAAPFFGYLELYTDIRHVNGEVTPFLHFNCDYISDDSVTTIHQSGFKPWPAGARFERGIVPTDGRNELTITLFNKSNDAPIVCRAELRLSRNGRRSTVERELPPVARDHMVLVDINDVFVDELARGVDAADVVIVADKPMHRPNFYLRPRGRRWSWTAVEHGAATAERILPPEKRRRLSDLGAYPWVCAFPILSERYEIDTKVIYFQEGAARLHDFVFELHDSDGVARHAEEVHCTFGQQINVTDWARERSLALDGGLLIVAPSPAAVQVAHSFSFLQGFQPRTSPYFSIGICGGIMPNIPFEWDRGWMWNHPMVPTVHTEQFGKAVVDDEFDTIVNLSNASAMVAYDRAADVDLDIYSSDGRMAHFRKTVPPNASVTFSIGDLLRDSDLPKHGHYALWAYCREQHVQGVHILRRRKDHAIGAQHFYYCRFNTLERDLPNQLEIAPEGDSPSVPAAPAVAAGSAKRRPAVAVVHAIMNRAFGNRARG